MRNVITVTILLLVFATLGLAQGCDSTRSCTTLYFYSSGSLQYVCSASAINPPVAVTVADASLTNISVATNVGTVTTSAVHGLWVGAVVQVTGSTVAELNATYIVATVPSTTTFTVVTAGVSDGTYNNSALTATTNSSTTGSPVWRILVYRYAAGVLASTSLGGGALSYNYRAKCSDRALY